MNTFGAYNRPLPLYDPRSIRENRQRFRRDALPLLERCNSFYNPSGRWPCRGWILLSRDDYNKLDKCSTALQLTIGDARLADNVKTLTNLCVVNAQCATRGVSADKNAIYLVEITDGRGVVSNKWFQFPLTAAYNIRSPAYPQTFQRASMDASGSQPTTWTWETMLRDIWTTMVDFLGAWPGLPSAPAGTPEGFFFTGVPAWTALCDILDHLGLEVACNPTVSGVYTIVSSGDPDPEFDAMQAKYIAAGRLEDDLEWIDVGAARVPGTIRVMFKRRNSVFGTEETSTYRSDVMAFQWDMTPYYHVDVTAPTAFSGVTPTPATGLHVLWSDFTVRYDDSSNPLDADIYTARAIASDLVSRYFDRIYQRTSGLMVQTYSGTLPFATGSQIDGVCYYQDYRAGDKYSSWRTQITRGVVDPWPEIYGDYV